MISYTYCIGITGVPDRLGMTNKRAIVVLIYALSLPIPATADGMGDMFGFMFRMMLTMMNIMAESTSNSNSWNYPLNSYGLGASGWPLMNGMSGMGGWPLMNGMSVMGGWPGGGLGATPWTLPMAGNPWASPLGINPFAGTGYGPPVNQPWSGIPGRWNAYQGASPLDGKWYGSSGEMLEVRGNRFVLRNSLTSLAGALDVDDDLVKMVTPQTGAVNIYQFARSENELVLEEPGGARLLFYRRPYVAGLPIRVF
jgi:hypothetical protein